MLRLIRFATALATLVLILVYPRYKRQKREVLERVWAGSRIAETPYGMLEYATVGTGQTILMMHGSGGWYEQGLLLAKIINPLQYRIVAVSRPGYGRTPVETGRTLEQFANASQSLLEQLGVENAAVLGISAGGLGAATFAERFPSHCRALILISAVSAATNDIQAPAWMLSVLQLLMASDFLMWLLVKINSQSMVELMTGKTDSTQQLSPDKREIVAAVVNGLFPVSLWRDGTINDLKLVPTLSSEMLEKVNVPTLVIHGTKDTLIPYAVAQHSAQHIPNAKLITVHGGSHLLIGTHKEVVEKAIDELLSS